VGAEPTDRILASIINFIFIIIIIIFIITIIQRLVYVISSARSVFDPGSMLTPESVVLDPGSVFNL